MPYYAEIAGGKVKAVTQTSLPIESASMVEIDGLDETLLGATYAGGVFTRVVASGVPFEVMRVQALIALSRAGISESSIQALIDAMPAGQARTEADLWWRESNTFQRNHPMVATLAPALGLTSEQVDALFIAAAGV